MIQINDPSECCGCTLCASICTHDAITMEPDALGFLYPKVNPSKCVDCGLCEKVCQFNDNYDRSFNLESPNAFAVRHKDISEVMKSRSGAAFAAISDYVLKQGGIVYGAGYKDHFRVAHKRATTIEERDEFRGSKYVQSDLTGIYRQVKDDLKSGLLVLFSGTPCQTSGLNAYVGKKYRERLILVDIVCHGVPSPYIWRDYISNIERKQKGIIRKVEFRDKEQFGWVAHKESFLFENKEIYKNTYTRLFYKHIMFRESCGVCHFTNLNRPSDITLADYWGWERNVPGFNDDDKGVSLVLLNTQKGQEVFAEVEKDVDAKEVEVENSMQPNLMRPSEIDPLRKQFESDYLNKGFRYILKQYGEEGYKYKLIEKVKFLKQILRIIFTKLCQLLRVLKAE